MISVPSGTERLATLGAATLRGKEERDSSGGTEAAGAHHREVWQRTLSSGGHP